MEIQVSSAPRQALHCAFCRGDLTAEPENTCRHCQGLAHPECAEIYGRCPVWGCGRPWNRSPLIEPVVTQPFQQPTPTRIERAVQADRSRTINHLWTHTMPHIAVGFFTVGIFAFTHPPAWIMCLAIVAFMVMSFTDTFTHNEEES